MNAANEVAVAAFLEGRIAFPQIWRVVAETMGGHTTSLSMRSLDAIMAADR